MSALFNFRFTFFNVFFVVNAVCYTFVPTSNNNYLFK